MAFAVHLLLVVCLLRYAGLLVDAARVYTYRPTVTQNLPGGFIGKGSPTPMLQSLWSVFESLNYGRWAAVPQGTDSLRASAQQFLDEIKRNPATWFPDVPAAAAPDYFAATATAVGFYQQDCPNQHTVFGPNIKRTTQVAVEVGRFEKLSGSQSLGINKQLSDVFMINGFGKAVVCADLPAESGEIHVQEWARAQVSAANGCSVKYLLYSEGTLDECSHRYLVSMAGLFGQKDAATENAMLGQQYWYHTSLGPYQEWLLMVGTAPRMAVDSLGILRASEFFKPARLFSLPGCSTTFSLLSIRQWQQLAVALNSAPLATQEYLEMMVFTHQSYWSADVRDLRKLTYEPSAWIYGAEQLEKGSVLGIGRILDKAVALSGQSFQDMAAVLEMFVDDCLPDTTNFALIPSLENLARALNSVILRASGAATISGGRQLGDI
ncbi:hypothetical protein RI367_008772, partial [Sorochytrium milnesiophthora]